MSAGKTLTAWGFMAKAESVYGTPVALAAGSDGVLLDAIPEPDIQQYIYDGARGRSPSGGQLPRTTPSGRFGGLRAQARAIGGGAAYSGSVFPSIHRLLVACGLEATLTPTGGSENYRYKPETGPTGLDSLTMEAYLAGQLFKLYGCYGTFDIEADGPSAPLWSFDFLGLSDIPTDVAIPTITSYPAATLFPPKAENIALMLGTFTAGVVRGFRFNANREHDAARLNLNAAASHAGFTPGGRNPTLELTLEKCALATGAPYHTSTTLNPGMLRDLGTQIICSLTVGSAQYNRWKIFAGNPASAAQAQIVEVDDDGDGPTGTWVLTIEFKASTYAAADEFSITFD